MKKANESKENIITTEGFMGSDKRNVNEIIEADLSELAGLGISITKLVSRMKEITNTAIPSLGNLIKFEGKYEITTEEAKGYLACPWPHPGMFAKRITIVKNIENKTAIKWSDLNIHLIEEHNFFEGKGSLYRIEPKEIVNIIF